MHKIKRPLCGLFILFRKEKWKEMKKSILFLCVLLIEATNVFGQVEIRDELIEKEKKLSSNTNPNIKSILDYQKKQSDRAARYAELTGIPQLRYDLQGNPVQLIGVDESGTPLYLALDNAGAAVTTGANILRDGDLKLEGQGIQIGIWDGGGIGHSDFSDRIITSQGGANTHANHVTGTILSSGTGNASAKGMAPKATGHTFDFGSDLQEMVGLVSSLGSDLVLSNHSYGIITGWRFDNGWTWFGNASISSQEDFRFGFYSTNAAQWDNLAYTSPNYLIVKSAGNERSDTGNNPAFPADCNGGTGYDCISDVSTSKNILTVGAVNKISNYVDASSVGMSSFSSWGPTDDGRIKPDLVAAGVNLFSTSVNNGYTTLSGTSMATPNATGSLALLQELYKKRNNKFMRASALKALAIHSVKEAGGSPGPDYRFGWGLLDVKAAADLIQAEDGKAVAITDYVLESGKSINFKIYPKPNTKVKVTIAWTDLPGIPVSASLDPANLMLVNDLDVRISDDDGVAVFPWILTPANPEAAATRGDNLRDNVEKIEFDNPLLRPYTIAVTHKGTLATGAQTFSLILEYTPFVGNGNAFYWVGGSGNWNDPSHWSLQSGGVSANVLPGKDDRVFFDSNSFPDNESVISLAQNQEVYAFSWLSNKSATIGTNGFSLTTGTNLFLLNDLLSFNTGSEIKLTGVDPVSNTIDLANGEIENLTISINTENAYTLSNVGMIKKLNIAKGDVRFNDNTISTQEFSISNTDGGIVKLSGQSLTLNNPQSIDLTESNLQWDFVGDIVFDFSDIEATLNLGSTFVPVKVTGNNASLIFNQNFVLKELVANQSELYFNSNNATVNQLALGQSTLLSIASGKKLNLAQSISIQSDINNKISISSHGIGSNAILAIPGRTFYCFDHLNINKVNIDGSPFVNAGLNSIVTQSTGWLKRNCNDVVYPDFTLDQACVSSLIKVNNLSLGNPDAYEWDFGDVNVVNLTPANMINPSIVFNSVGNKVITLKATKNGETIIYQKTIEVLPNLLLKPVVNLVGSNLISSITSTNYQWFNNYEPIEGATLRSINYSGKAGAFAVSIANANCNIISEPFIIASIDENKSTMALAPNPASHEVCFKGEEEVTIASITNAIGQKVQGLIKLSRNCYSVSHLPNGVYVIKIKAGNQSKEYRLVKTD
jgi:hypothetical protein